MDPPIPLLLNKNKKTNKKKKLILKTYITECKVIQFQLKTFQMTETIVLQYSNIFA